MGKDNAIGFSARAIANYFISRAMKDGHEITHMKIQKLCYMAHGWCLALLGHALIRDPAQAWEYGPVYPGLYHELKEYGKEPIREEIRDLVIEDGKLKFIPASIDAESDDEKEKEAIEALLEKIWEVYSPFTALQLSAMTHGRGTPWHDMISKYPMVKQKSIPIPDELIKQHYNKLAGSDNG